MVEITLKDPQLGPGRLYYELFWMYDILVVPAKVGVQLKYGSVQRATSQMRSGVPVLVEAYEGAQQDFVDAYNYTCSYSETNPAYWTFDEAVEAMKSVEIRKKCQEEGLKIAMDNSPNSIAKKQLTTLGYRGRFKC